MTQQTKEMSKTLKTTTNTKLVVEWGREKIEQLLPRDISFERFQLTAIECVRRSPKLLKCSSRSFLNALIKAAQVGLEIDGMLGSGYIVPYGEEAQFLPGYKGYLELMRRSGGVSRVNHGIVREADEFDWALGDEPFCKHRPLAFSQKELADDKIQFVYFIVKLANGEKHINVWPVARIRDHMERFSKSWQWAESGNREKGGSRKDSTWHQHFAKMAVKTVILDTLTSGEVPVSSEIARMAVMDRNLDMGIPIGGGPAIEDSQRETRVVRTADDLASALEEQEDRSTVNGSARAVESRPELQAPSKPKDPPRDPPIETDEFASEYPEQIPF